MYRYVCSVDIGGTKINTAIVDENGRVLKNIVFQTKDKKNKDEIIEGIIKSIYDVVDMAKININSIVGIGVAAPGTIDSKKGLIIITPNIKKFNNIKIVDILKEEFKIPVKLQNDCNAAALGESKYGSGRGIDNFVYMTISTGIGGGIIIDGKLYEGASGNAGEFGHMTIHLDGPICGCGNKGCFEAMASGTAIARNAIQGMKSKKESIIGQGIVNREIKAEDVFDAARRGDALAREILDNEAFYLGVGIANIINTYNPKRIVIGGGVSKNIDILYEKMMDTIRNRALKSSSEVCDIVLASLDYNSVILGAASLIFYND